MFWGHINLKHLFRPHPHDFKTMTENDYTYIYGLFGHVNLLLHVDQLTAGNFNITLFQDKQ